MKKRLTHIQGDHPVFMRIDKYLSDQKEIEELVEDLKKFNYENIKINGEEIKNDRRQMV